MALPAFKEALQRQLARQKVDNAVAWLTNLLAQTKVVEREGVGSVLQMQYNYMGVGDAIGISLAEVLVQGLPGISIHYEVELAGCDLTDKAAHAWALVVRSCTSLLSLDLTSNTKIGAAGQKLLYSAWAPLVDRPTLLLKKEADADQSAAYVPSRSSSDSQRERRFADYRDIVSSMPHMSLGRKTQQVQALAFPRRPAPTASIPSAHQLAAQTANLTRDDTMMQTGGTPGGVQMGGSPGAPATPPQTSFSRETAAYDSGSTGRSPTDLQPKVTVPPIPIPQRQESDHLQSSLRADDRAGAQRPSIDGVSMPSSALTLDDRPVEAVPEDVSEPESREAPASHNEYGKMFDTMREDLSGLDTRVKDLDDDNTSMASDGSKTDVTEVADRQDYIDITVNAGPLDKILNLCATRISHTHPRHRATLQFITILNIAQNEIQELQSLPPSLIRLDASGNNIRRITGLGACKMLTVLNLRRNRIHYISGLESNLALAHLFLGRNDISSVDNLGHLWMLETLDLSYNTRIGKMSQIRALSLHPSLAHLMLNGTNLEDRLRTKYKAAITNLCSNLAVLDNQRLHLQHRRGADVDKSSGYFSVGYGAPGKVERTMQAIADRKRDSQAAARRGKAHASRQELMEKLDTRRKSFKEAAVAQRLAAQTASAANNTNNATTAVKAAGGPPGQVAFQREASAKGPRTHLLDDDDNVRRVPVTMKQADQPRHEDTREPTVDVRSTPPPRQPPPAQAQQHPVVELTADSTQHMNSTVQKYFANANTRPALGHLEPAAAGGSEGRGLYHAEANEDAGVGSPLGRRPNPRGPVASETLGSKEWAAGGGVDSAALRNPGEASPMGLGGLFDEGSHRRHSPLRFHDERDDDGMQTPGGPVYPLLGASSGNQRRGRPGWDAANRSQLGANSSGAASANRHVTFAEISGISHFSEEPSAMQDSMQVAGASPGRGGQQRGPRVRPSARSPPAVVLSWLDKLESTMNAVIAALRTLVILIDAQPSSGDELHRYLRVLSDTDLLDDTDVPSGVIRFYAFTEHDLNAAEDAVLSDAPADVDAEERERVLARLKRLGDSKTCLRYVLALMKSRRTDLLAEYLVNVKDCIGL